MEDRYRVWAVKNCRKFQKLKREREELSKRIRAIDRQVYTVIRSEHERRYNELIEKSPTHPPLTNWVADFEDKYMKLKATRDDNKTVARYQAIIKFLGNPSNCKDLTDD